MTNNKGFFDTNIFVGISLLEKVELFFEEFISVKIAEQVYEEFEKWNIEDFSYRYIYTDTKNKVVSQNIEVVKLNTFNQNQLKYINYKTNEIKSGEINNNDLGEIHSVLMATLHEASYFCTNDNKFIKKNKENHFPELETKNLKDVLQIIHKNKSKEFIEGLLENERKENKKMMKELKNISTDEKHKLHNGLDDNQLKVLNSFKNKLSS